MNLMLITFIPLNCFVISAHLPFHEGHHTYYWGEMENIYSYHFPLNDRSRNWNYMWFTWKQCQNTTIVFV